MKPFDGELGMGEGVATGGLAASTGSLSPAAAAPRPPGDPEGSGGFGGSGGSRSPDPTGGGAAPRGYVGRVSYPGPPELGRGVVVLPGADLPGAWASCPRVRVGDAEVADPRGVTDLLHRAWLERRPVVVELAADQDALRVPQRHDGPVHDLSPTFEFTVERLHFLVWANTYDAFFNRMIVGIGSYASVAAYKTCNEFGACLANH